VSEVAEFVRRCPMPSPYLTLIGSSFQIIEIEPKKVEKRKRKKKKKNGHELTSSRSTLCKFAESTLFTPEEN
jgi:hypothetical protein